MGGFEISYIGAMVAGVLSFLSPCVLPLVPPYLCFMGGVSLEQMTDDSEELPPGVMRAVLFSSVAFIFGFTTVFVALGATASTNCARSAAFNSTMSVSACCKSGSIPVSSAAAKPR